MGSLNIAVLVLISHLSRFVLGTAPPAIFSSPTKFHDRGSEIKFPNSTHPEYTKCKESFGFIDCQNFTDYPSDFMKKLVSDKENAGLFQWCRNKNLSDAITMPSSTNSDPYQTPTNLCESNKATWKVSPQGVVVNGTFYYVIQAESDDIECYQKFRVVKCNSSTSKTRKNEGTCEYRSNQLYERGFLFKCIQVWALYKDLMVISQNNEIVKINVLTPSCCSCEYKQCDDCA